jgi:hypothetical protein
MFNDAQQYVIQPLRKTVSVFLILCGQELKEFEVRNPCFVNHITISVNAVKHNFIFGVGTLCCVYVNAGEVFGTFVLA